MEVNRLFRSELYNTVEHKSKTKYLSKMNPEQRCTLFGDSLPCRNKFLLHSPLLNDLLAKVHNDYQQFGIGKIQYPETGRERLSTRLMYMERALIAPEENLREMKVSVGILGMPRSRFDIMLREVVFKGQASGSGSQSSISRSRSSRVSRTSVSSKSQSSPNCPRSIFGRIVLPPKTTPDTDDAIASLPEYFPQRKLIRTYRAYRHEQCEKWLARLARFRNKPRQKESFTNRLHGSG